MVNLCKFAQKPRNYWEGFFVMDSSLEGFFLSSESPGHNSCTASVEFYVGERATGLILKYNLKYFVIKI